MAPAAAKSPSSTRCFCPRSLEQHAECLDQRGIESVRKLTQQSSRCQQPQPMQCCEERIGKYCGGGIDHQRLWRHMEHTSSRPSLPRGAPTTAHPISRVRVNSSTALEDSPDTRARTASCNSGVSSVRKSNLSRSNKGAEETPSVWSHRGNVVEQNGAYQASVKPVECACGSVDLQGEGVGGHSRKVRGGHARPRDRC